MTFATQRNLNPRSPLAAILAGLCLSTFLCLPLGSQDPSPPPAPHPAGKGTPEVKPETKIADPSKAAGSQGEADDQDPGKEEPQEKPQIDPTELLAPFDSEGLLGRLRSAVGIEHLEEDVLVNSLLPYLTGERKQLVLEVRTLIGALSDVRFKVREDAEKSLLNLGPRVRTILDEVRTKELPFEARVRLDHVKLVLAKMGDEDIQRRARMGRGLAECLEYRPGKLETGALMLALDHIDPNVRLAAIRSLGQQLRDPERAQYSGASFRKRILPELDQLNLERRNATLSALGCMPLPESSQLLLSILGDETKATTVISVDTDPATLDYLADIDFFVVGEGRMIKEGDGHNVVAGYSLKYDNFFEEPLDIRDSVDIKGERFKVIGIHKKTGNMCFK